ncbi:MAG: exo-alpha-sialidase [Chitinophagaceae bacterium]|nr:MAG: exo-alpha-sialidase [Chitinophagaceae bacterium]
MICLSLGFAFSQSKIIPVFISGQDGYKSFRIPAIIKAPNGDLLAFCEGRVNGGADFGHVNIVMKRSKDHGKSWSALQIVATNDSLQAGNAAPVVDLTDPAYPHGRIFLFYNTGNEPEGDIRRGIGRRLVWYKTSTDNGKTWSEPVNITSAVKKPDWRSYANTPGHAMQFMWGKYKGRIYVAANHSEGDPLPHFEDYKAHGYYTDDHGKTFHLSADVSFPGGNENMATELCGNQMMLNLRNQKGEPRCRIIAISSDGGVHWDTTYYDRQLPDPVCQGSIITLGCKHTNTFLAFCNNDDTVHRKDLTVRISFDSGKTWVRKYLVDKQGESTAYSDIVKLSRHKIGVLYERKDYSGIAFRVIKWRRG